MTCAAAAVVILPVTLRNYFVGGEWVLIASQGGVNFYIGNNPQSNGYTAVVPGTRPTWWGGFEDTHRIAEQSRGRELSEKEVSAFWYEQAWEWMRAEPGAWFKKLGYKFRLFWSPVELQNNQPIRFFAGRSGVSVLFWIGFPVVTCLALAGLTLLRGQRRDWALLLIFLGIYMATVVAFFCPARYRLPIVPVLIVCAAVGLVRLVEMGRARRLGRVGIYVLVGGLAGVALATNPPDREQHRRKNTAEGHALLAQHYETVPVDGVFDLDRALAHRRLAVQHDPTNAYPRAELARCLARTGRLEEADVQFAKAVALVPDYVDARLRYAEFLLANSRSAKAVELLREGHQRLPGEHRLLHALTSLLVAAPDETLRNPAEAIRLLEPAVAQFPQPNADLLGTLGAAYAAVGRDEDALELWRRAVEAARAVGREDLAQRIEAHMQRQQSQQAE